MKTALLSFAIFITLQSTAQHILKMEDGAFYRFKLNTIYWLRDGKMDFVAGSDRETQTKYYATVKFGKTVFDLTVFDTKTNTSVWSQYFVSKPSFEYATDKSSSVKETYVYVDGNTTYKVSFTPGQYSLPNTWEVSISEKNTAKTNPVEFYADSDNP